MSNKKTTVTEVDSYAHMFFLNKNVGQSDTD